jgi:cell division inhibitor SepF
MGAMYRLKAYFGMVPAEELVEYADAQAERSPGVRRRDLRDDRYDDRYGDYDDAYEDRHDFPEDRYDYPEDRFRGRSRPSREPARPSAVERSEPALRSVSSLGAGAVRGALAVDPDSVREQARPVVEPPAPVVAPVPEQRDRGAVLARITTLQPRSYKEARTIGERYRDGQPVIMNLTELDAADAKRLVDFAAGLAFALRGSIDKVTNRVFLLTPADVEVSADDARRLAERSVSPRVETDRGLFRQD